MERIHLNPKVVLAILYLSFTIVSSSAENIKRDDNLESQESRNGRLFPVFQVVTFPNTICSFGGSRNGTCYTSEECSAKGGSGSGTCASGFGVCCVFTLSCGSQTSENCTYLVQSSTSSQPNNNPCEYTICPCSSNICRIRLDFNSFTIASPELGTTSQTPTTVNVGGGIGDCLTDTFSVTSPGNVGTPVICGFNSGQHMVVDASDLCHKAAFFIGSGSVSREWDIKVTQYACGETLGGPDGCLQYFTGVSGKISSYNFPTTSTTIGSTVTHLSEQMYNICIRRESGFCAICYTPAITGTADMPAIQQSFGLSVSPVAIAAKSAVGTSCFDDYLLIPLAQAAPVTIGTVPTATDHRICGRTFNTASALDFASVSICSQSLPFKLTFVTNEDEVSTTVGDKAEVNEEAKAPGGIVGFSLNYVQQAC